MDSRYLLALKHKENEVFDKISSFGRITMGHDTTLLDGNYTAEDLRIIADAMDELKETKKMLKG